MYLILTIHIVSNMPKMVMLFLKMTLLLLILRCNAQSDFGMTILTDLGFRELILNGMNYGYSWNIPGQNHINIYNLIRHS